MTLVLSPRFERLRNPPLSIDLTGVVPDRLSATSPEDVASLTVVADGRPVSLGDLFEPKGTAADGTIELSGDCRRVHAIGAGMAWGRIVVRGSAGRHCGERMIGGRIEVEQDAGDWLAAEMKGGEIDVGGAAGDNVATALPGGGAGMSGGLVIVRGDVGDLAGSRMRRGILAVGGRCGEGAGFEMRAGTVIVAGAFGPHAGIGMRRGSILALAEMPPLGGGFGRGATWQPPVIAMILRRLAAAGFSPAEPFVVPGGARVGRPWVQWHGDRLAGGRGEVFVPAAAAGKDAAATADRPVRTG